MAWVSEALEPLGTVTRRPMMGETTLYLDGVIFAILADDALWLKADAATDARWDEAGCARFTFTSGDGKTGTVNYRAAPDDAYDEAEVLRTWAMLARDAGARAAATKKPRRKQ